MLPKGPEWRCKPCDSPYPTKKKVDLFYRNPLECIQSILSNPLVNNHIKFTPFRIYESAVSAMRIYTEWLTGDVAWSMQVCPQPVSSVTLFLTVLQSQLPDGATLLGLILSSDKTNLSSMTGGRVAHPLLLSLANLLIDFQIKVSNHAFLLLALLPVPKFIHKDRKTRGVLENRMIHECLDFILTPLKKAAQIGVMMSDPVGLLRYMFTPLAVYIVDVQEAVALSGVAGKTSHVTMASHKQFGDPFRHDPRTALTTLSQLHTIEARVQPWNLEAYIKEAKKDQLNGVHWPFWCDWALSEPSKFFTPEPLHHWHKMFWDHDAQWCIRALGSAEIDY
jgi:hypothetical protein